MPVKLPFSLQEYQERLQKTRQAMDRYEVDVLFSCDPSNMAWLTGYDGWSFYTHQGVLIGPEGGPIYWGRNMDAKGALLTCYMPTDDIIGYKDDFVMSEDCHAMEDFARLIEDRGWGHLCLGVEMENYYYTARAHHILTKHHHGSVRDVTGLVNWQRVIKSPTELGYMRRAALIVEKTHRRIFDMIEPGLRKNELAAAIFHSLISGAEDEGGVFGGDYPAILPLLPTGKDASAAHLTWNDDILGTGAGTSIEIAGCYLRYHVPLCRTIYLGEPPSEMLHAEGAILEGIEDGIAVARAGNSAGDVARAFYAVLEKKNIQREGRCGYSIGLSYPPDWGEHSFSIRACDETVLKEDMVFHFMPVLWMEDWGIEITESLRVREGASAECLADYPRKLFVKNKG